MVSVHPGGRCPESETKAEDARRHVGEIIGWNPAAERRAWYRPHSAIKPKRDNRRPCEPRANIKRPIDAHCNEKVAFLVAPEVRCTVDVAVSVRSRRGTALSSKVQKSGPTYAWGDPISPRTRFVEKSIWRGTLIVSPNSRPYPTARARVVLPCWKGFKE